MEFTKRTGLTIFEASAKSGHGVESSFIALTDALIDQAAKVSEADNNSTKQSTSNADGEENPYHFDQSKIKMKRIQGRGGLSQQEKAMMLCC